MEKPIKSPTIPPISDSRDVIVYLSNSVQTYIGKNITITHKKLSDATPTSTFVEGK